ncbi:MAG: NAD(P)-dependent methylenetetrahydromethanopterin dehydrogenase [Planctomycetaceae bacterium]
MKRILIQLDTDALPSSFDRVVAIDAGVDEVFSYGGVTPDDVEPLVHGAMFTRGPKDLKNTAIFIGGSLVSDGEALLQRVQKTFFGPVRVSVMMDPNGSNTTAAAAVLLAGRHLPLEGANVQVLGGTGPVGGRAAQLLAQLGAAVRVASRSNDRAAQSCEVIAAAVPDARLTPCEIASVAGRQSALDGVQAMIAAGAAGAPLISAEERRKISTLKVAIDLNAVPPAGLEGVDVADKAAEKDGTICYGAVGVGSAKMVIHRACLNDLFNSNDRVLDTAAILEVGRAVTAK